MPFYQGWLTLQRVGYRRQLKQRRILLPKDGVCVNYGTVLTGNKNKVIHGGRVKLLHLQGKYPEQKERFNILYLVSSAMPPFAEEIARWAREQGVKFIWNQNGVAYPAWAGRSYKDTNQVMEKLVQIADYVIYQSEFCRLSAERYLGQTPAPWEIVYNCVDTGIFKPRDAKLPQTPWIMLTTGSHQQPERVLSVLKALHVIKERGHEVRLLLAGRLDWEDAMGEVDTWIDKLGISEEVTICGPYEQEKAPALYQSAHALLHTKYKDPCPTVVIEAMACGVPVIGSRSGGMPELLGKEGGILIDVPESWDRMYVPRAEAIADAVIELMENLEAWGKRARARAVRLFGHYKWIEWHSTIFNSVVSGSDNDGVPKQNSQ